MMEEGTIQDVRLQVKCSRSSFFFFVIKSGLCCPCSHCNQFFTSKRESMRRMRQGHSYNSYRSCSPFLSTWFFLPLCQLGALQASLGWALGRLVFSKLAYGFGNWFFEGLKNKNCKSDTRSVLVFCLSSLGCLWEASNAFIYKTLGNKTM